MSKVVEALRAEPFYELLSRRQAGFEFALAHVERCLAAKPRDFRTIVETGSARAVDNWGGDGQSTQIWSFAVEHLWNRGYGIGAYAIDCDEKAVSYARTVSPNVKVALSDSLAWLHEASASVAVESCALLYLDSMDWKTERGDESAIHHLHELATVWARLPPDCLVMVDDRHCDADGKHTRVEAFMTALGRKPVYVDYQIAWVRG